MQLSWAKVLPASLKARLSGRQNLKKILANTGWLLADRVLRLGTGLIVGVWIARYLGPDQYGLLNYATAFVALFSAIATLGLDNIVIRDIVRDPTCRDVTLGTALGLKFIGAIVALLFSTVIMWLLRPGDVLTLVLVVLIAAGTILQAFDTIDLWFQSQLQSKFTVYAKNSAYLLAAALRITLILMHAPLVAFAAVASLEVLIGAVGLIVVYRINHYSIRAWKFSSGRAKELLTSSWPLILSGLVIIIYMRIDQVMLGQLADNVATGIYSAAVRISEIWYFVPTIIVNSVFPSVIRIRELNPQLYVERVQRLFDLMIGLSYLVAIFFTFSSGLIVSFLYGASYAASASVLSLHIWAGLFVAVGVAQGSWDVAEGLMKLAFQRTFLGAVINVVLNFILLPTYGAWGAALATVIAYAFAACVFNVLDRRTRPIFILQLRSLLLLNIAQWIWRRYVKKVA